MAMKMAVVSMEMTPGAIPRPGGVPEQRLLSPETCLRDGGGYGTLRGISSILLGFLRRTEYIGERAESEEPGGGLPTWWRGQGGAHAQVWCGPSFAPPALLWLSGSVSVK